jgi:hypothetical protein
VIIKFVKKLFLPSSGSSAVSASAIKPVKSGSSGLRELERPHKFEGEVAGSNPARSAISRRSFFSFMGTGVAMLAKPDLFLGPAKKIISGPNLVMPYGMSYLEEALFFQILTNQDSKLLPDIPHAPDGQALFSSTPWGVNWREDASLKKLAGLTQ